MSRRCTGAITRGNAGETIKAVPLAAAAPKERAEPPGIRAPKGLLAHLSLRIDLPVHFIDEKTVTATDVDPQQNRFRLPIDGVMRNLRPVLSHLVHVEAPRPRLPKLPKVPGEKTKKRRGRERPSRARDRALRRHQGAVADAVGEQRRLRHQGRGIHGLHQQLRLWVTWIFRTAAPWPWYSGCPILL
uniref:Uncharacterized protein n=1 Tax=Aegilops tauschii TaxID=37682 RepID=R7WAM5_AEGTA